MARRRWQEGTVYIRSSRKLPDAWWGRYVETVETESGTHRIQRNVRLGTTRELTKPLAKRALREYVDKANCYQPQAVKIQQMGKAALPFAEFAARWQEEVLIHMKTSTKATMEGHIKNLLIPAFGRLAVGDVDSERVQIFLNRLAGKLAAKTISNVWATIGSMWNSAMAWKYATGELHVELPRVRKLEMRRYSVEEVRRILAASNGAEQIFYWLAVETGLRAGESIALHVSDVNLENLSVEVNKAIWGGEEDDPKTDAGFRCICLSSRLGAALQEYLAGRTEGYLFRSSTGNAWDATNTLGRLNDLLERIGIPKYDPKLLAKFVGKNRTIAEATRSEKRHASAGLHTFRHTLATALDSLNVPMEIRKRRIGHGRGGDVTALYTHTFTEDERAAAEKLGELFGTGWPETDKGNLISFPNLSQKEEGLPARHAESPCESERYGCGGQI